MTVSLRTAILSGIRYCTQTVSNILPQMKPASVTDLLHQTQEQGSAVLSIGHGEILIEIMKDENGLRIFKADDEMSQNPVVIREGKENNGHAFWEAKVTKYLSRHFPKTSMVDFGVTHRRWKNEAFADLKNHLALSGQLRKQGEQFTLKLPPEDIVTFDGPDAELKSDIYLKHFYHRRKTPVEETESEPWDLLKRLAIGYLSLSGDLLTPWVKTHVLLPHQADHLRKKNSAQTEPDGFLDCANLAEMAKKSSLNRDVQNHLEQTSRANFQQNALSAAMVYAATRLASNNPKVAMITSLFSFVPSATALSAVGTREISFSKATNGIGLQKANAAAKSALARQTAPITIISPLPNLVATPGILLTQQIDMKQYFELSNPNSNLELTIKQSDGTAVPSWLKMNMGDISLINVFDFVTGSYGRVHVIGDYAYTFGSSGLKVVDVSNPKNPVVVGSLGAISLYNDVYIYGGYAYCVVYQQSIAVINISDPYNPILVNNVIAKGNSMDGSGNYIYLNSDSIGGIKIFDANNQTNPVQIGEFAQPSNLFTKSIGDYVVFGDQGNGTIKIINVSIPENPVLVSSFPGFGNSAVNKENYLYVGKSYRLFIYDITQITNPVVVGTVSLSSQLIDMVLVGDYIYASCLADGIQIVDVKEASNPQFVSTFKHGATRNVFLSGNKGYFMDNSASTLGIFDASIRVLSGRPGASDRGLLEIDVTASDDLGNLVVDRIAIHVGEISVSPIPNQQVYVGNSTLFTFAPSTFEFPGATFTYTAKLVGGLSLPPFISFDSSSRTFIFAPTSGDQNTYRIEVTANDGYMNTKTVFDLSVPDRPPVVEQPLANQTAYTGEAFEYMFAGNSFSDLDKDILSYSARLVGTNGLPGWLSFDPVLRKFYGTPFGKNVYPIEVTANDGFGGIASNTFTITVPNSAPILLNSPGTQLASVGIPFSYTFNTNTFYDVDNDPLTYSTDQLPGFLIFNPATRTFTGTPQVLDSGTYYIILQAQDPSGEKVSTTFSLTVLSSSNNNPPVLVKSIPDASEKAGLPFSFSFDSGSFEDPEGATLTYQATLEGGAPLPEGIYFDSDTRTLSGLLQTPQSFRITIRAVDPYGAFAVDTFTLNIIDNANYPPIVLNPLPDVVASVDQHFFFRIPDSTFADPNNDKLTISINQSGGQPLPKWLKWDPATNSLSGKPGPWDTGTYQDKVIDVEVWASDGNGSVKTTFKIIVQGQSFWEIFIKYGITFGSIAISGIGFFRSRALVWNYFMKNKYRKGTERAAVGTMFERDISLELKKVKEVKAYHNGEPMAKLPNGLCYEDDQLKGVPTTKSVGRYTIRIYDQDGYINEEFDLIIKRNANDPDPVEEKSHLQTKLAAFSSKFHTNEAEDDESREKNCFGSKSKKGDSSVMLESLLPDQSNA